MLTEQDIKTALAPHFPAIHILAVLSHYSEAVKKYQASDWEGSLLKSGKFVEATLKALLVHCGLTVPPARRFKVGDAIRDLGQISSTTYDDTARLLIPRACTFIYDIVSNRGTRHDPDKVNPNKMDASVVMPMISWILAEMIRFASGIATPTETLEQVENLTEKKYPHIENVDGRLYVNIAGLRAREIGLLLLHAHYPHRITRVELTASMRRHGLKTNPIAIALTRLKSTVDETDNGWKLRAPGREEAEKILSQNS